MSLLVGTMSYKRVLSSMFLCYADVTVLGVCCPSGCDSSLNLLVLVFISGAVSLFHVDVSLNFPDLCFVDIYW